MTNVQLMEEWAIYGGILILVVGIILACIGVKKGGKPIFRQVWVEPSFSYRQSLLPNHKYYVWIEVRSVKGVVFKRVSANIALSLGGQILKTQNLSNSNIDFGPFERGAGVYAVSRFRKNFTVSGTNPQELIIDAQGKTRYLWELKIYQDIPRSSMWYKVVGCIVAFFGFLLSLLGWLIIDLLFLQ